jgi:hypothetical protein
LAVAAGIAAQPLPSAAQRSHWYVKLTALLHVPFVVEKLLPTAAMPETTGTPVGAGTGATSAVVADAAYGEAPLTFVALTVERTVFPPSALVRT